MITVGCTGGIGTGKSTVCALLAQKDALVIDADVLARACLEPGGSGLAAVRERFGADVFDQDGGLDRRALAAVVFADAHARADLEAIVHPYVHAQILDRLARRSARERVTVLNVALLIETGGRQRYGLDGVLVVDAPEELALERLVTSRAMSEADAQARIAAQAPRTERLRAADFVILNVGTLAELRQMVDRAWEWMQELLLAKEQAEDLR